MVETKIIAAFPGTGKTYICQDTSVSSIEVEYWKYKDAGIENRYVEQVKNWIGLVDYIFISTDPKGLRLLQEKGLSFSIVCPEYNIREEYLNRYIFRDSSCDFIGAFMKYWYTWLTELKSISCDNYIELTEGQYLSDVLTKI